MKRVARFRIELDRLGEIGQPPFAISHLVPGIGEQNQGGSMVGLRLQQLLQVNDGAEKSPRRSSAAVRLTS